MTGPGDARPGASADDGRRAAVLAALADHVPGDATEARSLSRARGLVAWLPRPFDEHADATHVTGSAIVLDPDGRVVLHRHKRLGRWLQPGGHLDPGEAPAAAALRETREETGLHARHPVDGPRLVHVDVHPGPRGHLHLDLRYLLLVGSAAHPLAPEAGESPDVAWFVPETATVLGDHSLGAAVRAGQRART